MHSTLGAIPSISEKDAARLLVTPSALGEMGFEDALRVISYMKPKRVKAGAVFIREGEKSSTDFMMLLMSGEVRVETSVAGSSDAITMAVIGAGHLLGEIGMVSGSPRTATCIASTELAVAVLSRSALGKLIREEPDLAARFMLAVSSRMAERLRDTTLKLKRFMQLNTVLQKEVFTLMDSQGDLLEKKPAKKAKAFDPTEPMDLMADFTPSRIAAKRPARTSGYAPLAMRKTPLR